ncbi:MAG TPA: exodeoxyribonuclease VII small subunit [Candidatus Dormibacteraeota bacterium]|nr:exodeoxyribonuclease VII small subunit [Candidatus Dormibacteraeota bacterium]
MNQEARQPDQELSYERALELLDQKLKALEDDDLSLEEALATVDEARVYLRICERRLEEARRRIEVRPEVTEPVEPVEDG